VVGESFFYGECVNYPEFENKIKYMVKAGINMKPAFLSIASDWYRSNEQAFFVEGGPGLYQDLAPVPDGNPPTTSHYLMHKAKVHPPAYPVLVWGGRLKDSVTNPSSSDTVRVITDKGMVLGTKVPYGIFHQSSSQPRTHLPRREFLFNKSIGESRLNIFESNMLRWNRILVEYLKRQVHKAKGN
jgi:phage gpG-like protein